MLSVFAVHIRHAGKAQAVRQRVRWNYRLYHTHRHLITYSRPFAICRNPIYAFSLLAWAGLALAVGNLVPVFPTVALLGVLATKAYLEEQNMDAFFGPAYEKYKQRVKYRLFPYIW